MCRVTSTSASRVSTDHLKIKIIVVSLYEVEMCNVINYVVSTARWMLPFEDLNISTCVHVSACVLSRRVVPCVIRIALKQLYGDFNCMTHFALIQLPVFVGV